VQDREALGARIKRARKARGLTLKGVEAAAGISATHVSEIERGKTSPTTGALLRISEALGLPVAFFLEERELGSLSRVAARDHVRESSGTGGSWVERLTTAIAGGRLQAARVGLAPGESRHPEPHAHRGEEAGLVLEGRLRVEVGGEVVDLGSGDAIHYRAGEPHTFSNPGPGEAILLWVSSERGAD
jgi:transcriptional regulator with XRE-family HTH domain